MAYLVWLGAVKGDAPAIPALPCQRTPLAGTEILQAPHSGILPYLKPPGDDIAAGHVVAEVIHPITGQVSPVVATVAGVLYARHIVRWATTGLDVGKVSGTRPLRSGMLLSA